MFGKRRYPGSVPAPTAPPSSLGSDAIGFLHGHRLDPTPGNYALAWQVLTERRGLVAMAVDAIVMDGRNLTQADVDRIVAGEGARGSGFEIADPAHEAIRHQTLRLADLACDAAEQSSVFGRTLHDDLERIGGETADVRALVRAMIERANGAEAKLRAASREIERLREEVDASRDDALRDVLTDLPNRRGALAELNSLAGGRKGVLAIADVDRFKAINDRHGHGVGDRVLKGVASSLSDSLGVHTVARWGGEEFVVIMEDVERRQADQFLSRARADLAERRFRLRDTDAPIGQITVSIGAAVFTGGDVDAAIEAADVALYAAKRGGRNRVVANWHGHLADA